MPGVLHFTGSTVEKQAGIAQLAEHKLPKLGVAGSIPVARSISTKGLIPFLRFPAGP